MQGTRLHPPNVRLYILLLPAQIAIAFTATMFLVVVRPVFTAMVGVGRPAASHALAPEG
jgi:hypothetical protein